MEQRSDEWLEARVGKITASRIKGITAKPKAGQAINATLLDVLSERLTGIQIETPITKAMQWGIDCEPLAKHAYELATFRTVVECGFIPHHIIPQSGASPDGLIGDDGLIEIKCPDTTKHLNTLITGQVPSDHLPQIIWQLACTGRDWCDFVSFDPRLEPHLQIKIIRVERDETDIDKWEQLVIQANELLDKVSSGLSNQFF